MSEDGIEGSPSARRKSARGKTPQIAKASQPDGTTAHIVIKVLLIEDDPVFAGLIGQLLATARGITADLTCVTLLSEGLERLAKNSVDVLLLDLGLPDSSGLKTLARARTAAGAVPIVVLTGCDDDELAAQAVREGAQDFLVKSDVRGNLLVRTLRYAIERRRAEEALRKSELKYRCLHESLRDAFVSVTMDGQIQEMNHTYQAMLGYSAEELRRLTHLHLTPQKWHAAEARIVAEQILPRGYSDVYEKEYRRKDGTVFPVELRVFLVKDDAGRPANMWAIVRDITERKQAEATILRLNRLYSVLSKTNEALARIKDRQELLDSVCRIAVEDGRFLLAWIGLLNAQTRLVEPVAWAGSEDGYVQRVCATVDDVPRGRGTVGTAIRENRHDVCNDIRNDRRMAPWRNEALRRGFRATAAFPLQSGPGAIGALTIYLGESGFFDQEDVQLLDRLAGNLSFSLTALESERERALLEEQLRQAQKIEAIGQLAGGVAHDFNNLLFVINGRTEMALKSLKPGDPLRAPLELIGKTGQRAANLTQQLLAFGRRQVLQPKVLNLNAVIADVEKMLRRLIREDITFTAFLDPKLESTKADPGQLTQVLMNLVVNARDAMPKGGKLTLETKNAELDEAYCRRHPYATPGRYVMLGVSDSGCGMDDYVKAHIFEPFFTTKGQGQGTGLGLATVYGIVKQSGGSIEVHSELGEGTTFTIYLPQAGDQPARASRQISAVARRGHETILLVEDENDVLALVREILESNGYIVLPAGNGVEALRVCEQHKGEIHLAVCDVIMPKMNGPELARQLASRFPDIKVLFMSGYADQAIADQGVLSPEAHFIQKPVKPSALARKVREVLGGA